MKKEISKGIIYGIVPHIGCIAFIAASVLGVTFLTQLFKPLLMNRHFFYFLILLSLLFATISSVIYLRNNGILSLRGIKRKWKYLSLMYGSTIGVNLFFFMLIFPMLANFSPVDGSPAVPGAETASVKLEVDIPCSGHAALISGELKTIQGIDSVKFLLPNYFLVTYDPSKTSVEEMLSLSVFREFPAKTVSS